MKRHLTHPISLTLVTIVLGLVVLASVALLSRPPALVDGATVHVRIDREIVKAPVVATEPSRAIGLANTASLGQEQGMLFVFEQSDLHSFWMKGVEYPIDIIWISGETVSEVTPNVPPAAADTPDEALPRYQPQFPVDRVLEVPAGWAGQHHVQPGDPVRISG